MPKGLVAFVQAADCISRGMQKFNNGDRMGALKLFEESLQKVAALGHYALSGHRHCSKGTHFMHIS